MSTSEDFVKDDHPDQVVPTMMGREKWVDKSRRLVKAFTTKEGLVGNYDYAYLFKPNIPFLTKKHRTAPFFGLNDRMPVLLAALLGLQHSLAMLAGIITPPILLSAAANLEPQLQSYLVSTALIVSGILSIVQITRVPIWKTQYFIGTGLVSVVGVSFNTIPVATGSLAQMYQRGICPTDANGTQLPCPEGYGMILATQCCCGLLQVLLSFIPPKILRKIFPPLVTGPTVLLIGVNLIQTGFKDWAGGSGSCMSRPETGPYRLCPAVDSPHALPWGSAQFIGLGFLVFLTIILCERFGAPIMKSCSVVIGLLVGCIVAAACNYFDKSGIDAAPVVSFIWVHTFPLKVYGPLVLPLLAVVIVTTMETIGDVTATCDVSRLQVDGALFDSRLQGGVLADGLNGILAGLCTITPMSTFAQNNGVISLTKCANRKAGYACCIWLFIMGLFAKFAAALVAIPDAVLGGMTTFLFTAVAVSGIRIVSTMPFTRRNRFILTASLAPGFGAILVPDWFSFVFTYHGNNHELVGFFDAIELVMETGFAVCGFLALILNLLLPEEPDDEEVPESTANMADDDRDRETWSRTMVPGPAKVDGEK